MNKKIVLSKTEKETLKKLIDFALANRTEFTFRELLRIKGKL